MPSRLALAASLLVAAVVGMPCLASSAQAAGSDRADFRIDDDRITESSGLALSVRHPHTVWTVNDSGDSARVFATDTETGKTVGVHTFDAEVRDVEALAITPQGRMLVPDIGDNAGSREVVRVFWFDEPGLGKTSGSWASWELSYPDGPHNAEALAVDPLTGRVFVVTKEQPGGIYALPIAPSRRGLNRLTKVGTAPGIATDAVFVPDGSGLAVRTYTSLHLLNRQTWTEQVSGLLPLQPQGETIAVAPGGTTLLIGSEGKSSRVLQVDLPRAPGASVSPSPSRSPSGPATPSAGATSAAGSTATSTSAGGPHGIVGSDRGVLAVNRRELMTGLGASAGLVLLAFLVTRLGRRGRR